MWRSYLCRYIVSCKIFCDFLLIRCDAVTETVRLSPAVKFVFSGANAEGFDALIVARLTGEELPPTLVAVVVKVVISRTDVHDT